MDTSRQGPPPSQVHIDDDVASALVGSLVSAHGEATELADAPIGPRFDGWDMAVFRLGEHHALRVPRTAAAVTSLGVEARVLGELGDAWGFPHPRIVHLGEPTSGYPWPWAVTTWLAGTTADLTPLGAQAGDDVGRALAQVHTPAVDAPHNLEQSIPLEQRSEQLDWALGLLERAEGPQGERIALAEARELWADALAAPRPGEPVWSHADAHGSNLLGVEGAFAGIIDWGKAAACDRAVDLAFLFTAMPASAVVDAFVSYRAAAGIGDAVEDDQGLECRARGIALTKAAAWATLPREVNVVMAWRALAGLGLLA